MPCLFIQDLPKNGILGVLISQKVFADGMG